MFEDGKMNGQGSYTFINGNLYIGEFKDGKGMDWVFLLIKMVINMLESS